MKKWLVPIIGVIILCVAVTVFLKERIFQEESMSEADVVAHIEKLYSGKVEHIEEKGDRYEMQLTRQGSRYEVAMDVNTHKVTDLVLKESAPNQVLKEAQIRQLVSKYTSGKIDTIELDDNENKLKYKVKVVSKNTIKNLMMDAYTGIILSETNTPITNEPSEISVVISEQEAIRIAKKQLTGEVESVEYKETADGGYYLIEIEGKENEAVLQIHAVSGKVMSVTWDEEH